MLLTVGQFWLISLSLFTVLFQFSQSTPRTNALLKGMESLTKRLGGAFFEFSNGVTKFNELRDSFSKSADSIEVVNVQELFKTVMNKVNGSLQGRVDAIEKLASFAEERALAYYKNLPPKEKDPAKQMPPIPPSYFNSKLINKTPKEDDDKEKEEEVGMEIPKVNCTYPMELLMTHNEHFKAEVNMDYTSVHVPTSIYECEPALLEALYWSSELEESFIHNYRENPTLGWQYFGSSTGFLRQYPAMEWPNDNWEKGDKDDKGPPDLYDCRFRPWYTASASSPKNLLILLDASGSMTGLRRRIAKAVVNSILDTLTENDYVNVFNFSETTEVLVECTKDETGKPVLVQATMENIRDFRVGLEQKQTKLMANFEIALKTAFETLEYNLGGSESANCSQAIMIVSDGAPEHFKALFEKWNSEKRIRIFTYLVGREVTDKNEIQEMACDNRGFFVHVSILGEVQEQVIKYLNVMSRPLVMSQQREINWTPVYANQVELIESEWQWQERTKKRQEERSKRYKWFYQNVAQTNANKSANKSAIIPFSNGSRTDAKNGEFYLSSQKVRTFLDYGFMNVSGRDIRRMEAEKERVARIIQDSRDDGSTTFLHSFVTKFRTMLENQMLIKRNRQVYKDFEFQKFNFFVSASYPVFDVRNSANSTTNSKGPEERIANFLGVVGTDISIDELKNLASPFELGVNAYAFAITNNGHIIFHPDFRPLYENILKPTYNTVDLTEVELVDKDLPPLSRNTDEELLQMRKEMIDKEDHTPSIPKNLSIRIHHEAFKRVSIRKQNYVFGKIPRTVYTLAIQVPLNATTYKGQIEVSLHWRDKGVNIVHSYFDPNISYTDTEDGQRKTVNRNWRIHPDWVYCQYLTPAKHPPTKEDTLVHFIKRIQGSTTTNMTWSWGHSNLGWAGKEGDHYICNKELVQSVVFDAMITRPFSDTKEILKDPKLKNLVAKVGADFLSDGVLTTIVATRSGLTRWVNHPKDGEKPTDLPFTEYHPRTVEESWYQRSVERVAIEEDSYVVSVAFDAGTRNYSRVTVTRAVMASKGGKKAPAAVVGIQYDLDKFISFFGIGPEYRQNEPNICQEDDFHCYILDENAFVIGSSEIRDDAGQVFGEVDRHGMEALINSSIYKEVRVVDFQGVCLQQIIRTSFANALLTPFRHILLIVQWLGAYLASFLLRLNFPMVLNFPFVSMDSMDSMSGESDDEYDTSGDRNMHFVEFASINKTKLRPCDVEYKLFTYGSGYNDGRRTFDTKRYPVICDERCEDYLNVQRIPHTNLILVIVEATKCRCGQRGGLKNQLKINGEEVVYPIYKTFLNRTADNPVLLELCRIPQKPLYRKRLSHCYAYAEDESIMKQECGLATCVKMSYILIFATFSSLQFFSLSF